MGLWESILGFGSQFGPHNVVVGDLVVNFGPLGVYLSFWESFSFLGIDFEPRGLFFWRGGVDFRSLSVNFFASEG